MVAGLSGRRGVGPNHKGGKVKPPRSSLIRVPCGSCGLAVAL